MSENIYITRRTSDRHPDKITVEMSSAQYAVIARDARTYEHENQTLCQTAETRPYVAYDRFKRIFGQIALAPEAQAFSKTYTIEDAELGSVDLEDERILTSTTDSERVDLYRAAMLNLLTDPREKALELSVLLRTEGDDVAVFGEYFPVLSLNLEQTSDQAA